MSQKFRKKPVIIEAVQWTGKNLKDAILFCPDIIDLGAAASPDGTFADNPPSWPLQIKTLEGNMICTIGDWIIKGVNGEFYPCKPDIFEKTYEPVTE